MSRPAKDEWMRFWDKVKIGDGCWEWVAKQSWDYYGVFWFRGRNERAHRASWTLNAGNYNPTLQVLHHCDNRLCVRPSHLFLGTHQDNMADKARKGRCNPRRGPNPNYVYNPKCIEWVPRGEDQHLAKLTDEKVREIRAAYSSGMSQTSLAKRYGVSQPCIGYVVRKETWTHVK